MHDESTEPRALKANRGILILTCLLLLGTLAVVWIVPLRMALGKDNSYFAYALIEDEPRYADCIQPLLSGATRTNPTNGFGDNRYLSPFFLEDLLREVLSITGIHVITAYWLWRFIFPVLILISFYLLLKDALPANCKTLSPLQILVFALFSTAILYLEPLCFFHHSPVHGWLNRIPTNIEFLLSIHMAWHYCRFLQQSSVSRSAMLSVQFALLVYLRLYAAIPWAIVLGIAVVVKLARRQIPYASVLAAGVALVIALTPWVFVVVSNKALPIYTEIATRFFGQTRWRLHYYTEWYIGLAAVFILFALRARFEVRLTAVACGLTIAAIPFLCGFLPFGREVIAYDRFSSFYIVAFLTVLTQRLAPFAEGNVQTTSWVASAGIIFAVVGLKFYGQMEYKKEGLTAYSKIAEDIPAVTAYQWIEKSTPGDALFVCGDVSSQKRRFTSVRDTINQSPLTLFSVIAKRRMLFNGRICVSPISDSELMECANLNVEVFGNSSKGDDLLSGLRSRGVTNILYRKSQAASPNLHPALHGFLEEVYSDEHCQIWRINWENVQ